MYKRQVISLFMNLLTAKVCFTCVFYFLICYNIICKQVYNIKWPKVYFPDLYLSTILSPLIISDTKYGDQKVFFLSSLSLSRICNIANLFIDIKRHSTNRI